MAEELSVPALTLQDPAAVMRQVENYRQPLKNEIILLTELGGGAIRFAAAAFPDASLDQIYAQHNIRESEGRGPHFDIYNENIDEAHPWLGIYNLAGRCTVSAAVMPEELSGQYAKLYPEATEEAYEARRHFGALVLNSDSIMNYSGTLQEGTGLILPQQKGGPNIVHKVVPENLHEPGSFLKLVVPIDDATVLESLYRQGFMPLDELLTNSVDYEAGGFEAPIPIRPTHAEDHSEAGIGGSGLLD